MSVENKNQCGIVCDLMPLVMDGVASEQSKNLVEVHLTECQECQAVMNDMRAEIKAGKGKERDENFFRLSEKVRKSMSRVLWKKVLLISLIVLVVYSIAAGGILITQDKMYRERREYSPKEYSIGVDDGGFFILEYALDGEHGSLGVLDELYAAEGVVYLTPYISAWPQVFDPIPERVPYRTQTIQQQDDGTLDYLERSGDVNVVYDEALGKDRYIQEIKHTKIIEIRLGTKDDYEVIYRPGYELPFTGLHAQESNDGVFWTHVVEYQHVYTAADTGE